MKNVSQKKQAMQAEMPATTGEFFFTFALQFSTFHYNFKLVQRTFCDGSITFLEINLICN